MRVTLLVLVAMQLGCSRGTREDATEVLAELPPPVAQTGNEQTGAVESAEWFDLEERDEELAQSAEAPVALDPVATGLRAAPVPVLAVRTVVFNHDASLIAVGNGAGQIGIWSRTERTFVKEWGAHQHWVFDLVFDADSKRLLSAGGDNRTLIWSLDDGELLSEFEDHVDDVHGVAMTPDGKSIVTGSDDTELVVRNLETGKVETLSGHTAQVTSVVLTPDGKTAFSSSRDQTIRAWDLSTLKELGSMTGHAEDVLHLAIDPTGQYLASASYDGTVKVWSVQDLQLLKTLPVSDAWVFAVAFSKDGNQVISGGGDHLLRVHSWQDGLVNNPIALESDVSDIAVSLDGNWVAVGTSMSGVKVYEFADKQLKLSNSFSQLLQLETHHHELSVDDYLTAHSALVYEQDTDDWSKKVGLLGISGDRWTIHLLSNIDAAQLPPPKREMHHRLTTQLRSLFQSDVLNRQAVVRGWERLTAARLLDLPIAEELSPWLKTETTNWIVVDNDRKRTHLDIEQAITKVVDDTVKNHELKTDPKAIKQAILNDVDNFFRVQ